MRYLLLFAILLLIFSNTHSQNPPETRIDSMLVDIDKSRFTSGVLYDRVMPWSNLSTFNDSVNISNTKHFEQALLELYNASNKTKFISPQRLKANYSADSLLNIVDVGILNASFHQLNYNLKEENEGGLRVLADKFEKIDNGKPAFLEKHLLLIAPLKMYAVGPRITFRFDNGLLIQDSPSKRLITLTANFDTGADYTVLENGSFKTSEIILDYVEEGYKILTFTASFSDGTTQKTEGVMHVKLSYNLPLPPGVEDVKGFESDYFFTEYDTSQPDYSPQPSKGKLDYRVYYHTINGIPESILKKTISNHRWI